MTGCLQIPPANANIAFTSDSMTAFWRLPKNDLGVYGNSTAQMLARYPSEVPNHGYKAIVILGADDVRVPRVPIAEAVTRR